MHNEEDAVSKYIKFHCNHFQNDFLPNLKLAITKQEYYNYFLIFKGVKFLIINYLNSNALKPFHKPRLGELCDNVATLLNYLRSQEGKFKSLEIATSELLSLLNQKIKELK